LVREITRFYYANPTLRAQLLPVALALHDRLGETRGPSEFNLTPQETQQIKDIFELFDTDGGGTIDSEELSAALFALGFHGNKERRSKTKAEITSTAVTLEDFLSILKGEKSISCQNEDVWLSFSVLCQSGRRGGRRGSALQLSNFELDRQEVPSIKLNALKIACQEFEVRLEEDELVYMMDEADYDKSGSIDIHKFMHILRRTPWF
jgi:Ca2+-binding EF-hand superfamily protein